MNRHDINEAATATARFRWGDSRSQHVIAKHVGTVYGFKSGIEWFLNTVWHDGSEEYERYNGRRIIVIRGNKVDLYDTAWTVYMQAGDKWVYLDELLPLDGDDEDGFVPVCYNSIDDVIRVLSEYSDNELNRRWKDPKSTLPKYDEDVIVRLNDSSLCIVYLTKTKDITVWKNEVFTFPKNFVTSWMSIPETVTDYVELAKNIR